jgi:hypothetical protein
MINYSLILATFYGDKTWTLIGGNYSGIDWQDSSPKPTQAELDALWQTTLDKINADAYIAKRAAEYPSFADQFDTIFHDGLDAWKAQIQAVKDKYPKGTV